MLKNLNSTTNNKFIICNLIYPAQDVNETTQKNPPYLGYEGFLSLRKPIELHFQL